MKMTQKTTAIGGKNKKMKNYLKEKLFLFINAIFSEQKNKLFWALIFLFGQSVVLLSLFSLGVSLVTFKLAPLIVGVSGYLIGIHSLGFIRKSLIVPTFCFKIHKDEN